MSVFAMSGHVDHGKSTFLKYLTQKESDRLLEEKKRGMTIDLNFVWLELQNKTIGIIDVPGHKDYLKNMIAGVFGVDAFIFIVAAEAVL
jgi:selenocysteine-specific elongation factor